MDGKKIQIRKMGSHQGFRDGKWYDVENPRWDFDSCDYRVAPEPPKPREWWICNKGNGWTVVSHDVARPHGTTCCSTQHIKVKEVIEVRD